MKTLKPLSKTAEDRLLSAVKKVAEAVDEGATPTSAVVKVAEELELPRGHVTLLCHAYNTGQVNAHRKQASDGTILDKLEDLPLASEKEANDQLFPEAVESPSQQSLKLACSTDYAGPPSWLQEQKHAAFVREHTKLEKAAEARPEHAFERNQQLSRNISDIDRTRKAAEAARGTVTRASDDLMRCICDGAAYFRAMGQAKFAEVWDNVEASQDRRGLMALRTFAERAGIERKQASSRYSAPLDWSAKPYATIRQCVKLAEDLVSLKLAAVHADTQAKIAKEKVFPKKAAPAEKSANLFSAALGSALGTAATRINRPEEDLLESQTRQVDDPEHDQQLRGLNMQATLADLMAGDEVVRGYHPEAVTQAYNEISRMMPLGSVQPTVIRPLLRRRLQGNLEPFEAEQMAGLERKLQQLQRPGLSFSD